MFLSYRTLASVCFGIVYPLPNGHKLLDKFKKIDGGGDDDDDGMAIIIMTFEINRETGR